jgi:hypothetical protein
MDETIIPDSCDETVIMSEYVNVFSCALCASPGEEVCDREFALVSCDGCNGKYCYSHFEELRKCSKKECTHLYCPECITYDFELQYVRCKQAHLRNTGKRLRPIDRKPGVCLACTAPDQLSGAHAKRRRITDDA